MDREKTKITVDLYTDTINSLKGFSGTRNYAHILREIVDIGIHFYKEGARVSPTVTMPNEKKDKKIENKKNTKDIALDNILE